MTGAMRKVEMVWGAVVLVYAALACGWYAVSGRVDHDEHQFMASAYLVARQGLHPYVDFAYFHMPNLVYLYAPLCFAPQPFLCARLAAGACALGLCILTWRMARAAVVLQPLPFRMLLPTAAVALLVHSPLLQYAASHVWNHTPSALSAVLAFMLHARAVRGTRPAAFFALSGACLGMALGVRLSCAPLVVPFLWVAWAGRAGAARDKVRHVLAFAAGGALANLPSLYFLCAAGGDFLFGNLGYARLSTMYRVQTHYTEAMTVAGKLQALGDAMLGRPAELAVVLAALCAAALGVLRGATRGTGHRLELQFLLALLPFLIGGSLAPTPTFYQYHFAPVPFLVLITVYGFADLVRPAWRVFASGLLTAAALVSFAYGTPCKDRWVWRGMMTPEAWVPVAVQREADEIEVCFGARSGAGPVLTLSPIYVLAAGLPVVPEFATGPFAWRVSHLLPMAEADARGLPSWKGALDFVAQRKPRALLTGKEEEVALEIPLIQAARRLGYFPVTLPRGAVVWYPSP